MLEITNKQRGPISLIIRSRKSPRDFTILNIPGIGHNKNKYLLEDERVTDYIYRAETDGLISTRFIKDSLQEGVK
jgi:hypothetical protein